MASTGSWRSTPNGTTYFAQHDHLGSTRLLMQVNGTTGQNSWDYYPFGEIVTSGYDTTHLFTGDEYDSESNLDHTQFRQYSSSLGRWMSPDPAGLAAVDPTNPQSWNRYSYVLNNPLALIDPLGLSDCPDDKSTCGDDPGENTGAPGVGIWGNFGPGNPANGCDTADITNCAADRDNRDTARDIASENAAGFTALNALLNAESDFTNSIDEANQRYSRPPGGPADIYILVHCLSAGVDSWECSPWGPYAQYLAAGWTPALIGDEARLRYLARRLVSIAQPGINLSIAGTAPPLLLIGGLAAVPAAGSAIDAAQAANGYVTAAAENSIAWENVYDFTKGVVNPRAFPLTPGGVLGGLTGAVLRAMIGQ